MNEDNATTYLDDRKLREAAVFDLACIPITCPEPNEIPGMTLMVMSAQGERLCLKTFDSRLLYCRNVPVLV